MPTDPPGTQGRGDWFIPPNGEEKKMSDYEMTPIEKIKTATLYGGIASKSTMEMVQSGMLKSIGIVFPDIHSAASWAMTNGIEHQVNIVVHPIHFDEPLAIRYFFGE